LPNRLTPVAVGGTRFLVKPLPRAVTFPQTAFVLAPAQGCGQTSVEPGAGARAGPGR
jgi:hypothetical protein